MSRFRLPTLARLGVIAAAFALPASELAAQSLNPAFQPPRTVQREYHGAIADGDGVTMFLAQWQESLTSASAFRFDGGLVDIDGSDLHFLIGATYLRQLNNAGPDVPLDFLLTAGGQALLGDITAFEVPVGVSVGRRFPLDAAFAITPFVHPRVALQYCSDCVDETDLGIAVDIGVDLEISSRMSLRGAFMIGSDDADAIGIGLAWRPSGLRR